MLKYLPFFKFSQKTIVNEVILLFNALSSIFVSLSFWLSWNKFYLIGHTEFIIVITLTFVIFILSVFYYLKKNTKYVCKISDKYFWLYPPYINLPISMALSVYTTSIFSNAYREEWLKMLKEMDTVYSQLGQILLYLIVLIPSVLLGVYLINKIITKFKKYKIALSAIISLILLFFNHERISFFSARFWFLVWGIEMIIWLVFIIKKLKEIPKLREQLVKEKEYNKYIP